MPTDDLAPVYCYHDDLDLETLPTPDMTGDSHIIIEDTNPTAKYLYP